MPNKIALDTTSGHIAVVGSGIAGLATAWLLSRRHKVTLYEADQRLGGHTHTVDVECAGQRFPVDTGFLVFNDRTYPNLIALFAELGIRSHESDMSFAVSLADGQCEWAGSSLATVFAQKRNLWSPRFLGMLRDILRFNRHSHDYLELTRNNPMSLGELLDAQSYGSGFRNGYLLPMAAAIWSSKPLDILAFPAETFLRFCINHGLLQIEDRPQWRTVLGGGREYVRCLRERIAEVRAGDAVRAVSRMNNGVRIVSDSGSAEFDAVVLAGHAPDSLAVLQDASEHERNVIGAVRYQDNEAYLHTDISLLPKTRQVWSAWNYLSHGTLADAAPVCVSYLINRLQPLPVEQPVIVTLNPIKPPDPAQVIRRIHYAHPVFDRAAIEAQRALPALQGQRHTWYAGAWTGYGFHEDGLKSALRVAQDFGCLPAWAQL